MPPTVNHTLCYSRLEFSSPFLSKGPWALLLTARIPEKWRHMTSKARSDCGLGSHRLSSGLSEGNLYHANQRADELLTSSCKRRLNGTPEPHPSDSPPRFLYRPSLGHSLVQRSAKTSHRFLSFSQAGSDPSPLERENETEVLSRDPARGMVIASK